MEGGMKTILRIKHYGKKRGLWKEHATAKGVLETQLHMVGNRRLELRTHGL